jgi:hypothetical protein
MGDAMYSGKRLDDLIEAGWHVVDTEFDARALYYWRKKALDFLTDFVGPDHACTQIFRHGIEQPELFDCLDGSEVFAAGAKDHSSIEERANAPFELS